jgi:hypothetical protein
MGNLVFSINIERAALKRWLRKSKEIFDQNYSVEPLRGSINAPPLTPSPQELDHLTPTSRLIS